MRLGECSCLLVNDVCLAKHQISLRADITKGCADRVVFFSPRTEIALRRWIQFKDRYVESDYLFPMKHNGAHIDVRNFEKNFKKYLNRTKVNEKLTPHSHLPQRFGRRDR